MEQVVFHINEQSKWEHLIANVQNLIKGLKDVEICVVANGKAVVDYFNNELLLIKINDLTLFRVKFEACRNSLISNKLVESQIPSIIEVIPSGVVELVLKQKEGYYYIKV